MAFNIKRMRCMYIINFKCYYDQLMKSLINKYTSFINAASSLVLGTEHDNSVHFYLERVTCTNDSELHYTTVQCLVDFMKAVHNESSTKFQLENLINYKARITLFQLLVMKTMCHQHNGEDTWELSIPSKDTHWHTLYHISKLILVVCF